jgi:hypothetical protein
MLVDGDLHPSEEGRTDQVLNPSTGEVVAEVQSMYMRASWKTLGPRFGEQGTSAYPLDQHHLYLRLLPHHG